MMDEGLARRMFEAIVAGARHEADPETWALVCRRLNELAEELANRRPRGKADSGGRWN